MSAAAPPWRHAARVAVGAGDVRLHVAHAGEGPPLLLLHGFTGSADSWAPFVPTFGAHHALVAPDLLGHARSDAPADASRYEMPACVRDLLALLDHLRVDRCAVLGYSMGGRVALALALAAPERVRALVLESASPGLADAAERAARTASDAALADDIERDGVAAFAERWARLPLWESQASLDDATRARLHAERLRHTARGLANSLRGLGTGVAPSQHERLATLRVPTLLVAGALDGKFAAIAHAMAAVMPDARAAIVAGAGHAVHLERPGEFGAVVGTYLGRV